MSNYIIQKSDTLDTSNPSTRVPVCICLDTSGSMGSGSSEFADTPIDELNKGVRLFYDSIKADETASFAADICLVTFGGYAKLAENFSSIDQTAQPPVFSAYGGTPMGEAVNMALDCLEQRKQEYKKNGIDYYQPWLVLMTDGEPNGDEQELSGSIQRVKDMVSGGKLTVFPIGIGNDANMDVLKDFSPKRPPLKLKGLNFSEFFTWLSQSISQTSISTPGESVPLGSVEGWATL